MCKSNFILDQKIFTMNNLKYVCPKCGGKEYEIDEFRATGGFWTKIFDIQNKHFTTISCKKCSYTEIYKTKSNNLENVFDFLTN